MVKLIKTKEKPGEKKEVLNLLKLEDIKSRRSNLLQVKLPNNYDPNKQMTIENLKKNSKMKSYYVTYS